MSSSDAGRKPIIAQMIKLACKVADALEDAPQLRLRLFHALGDVQRGDEDFAGVNLSVLQASRPVQWRVSRKRAVPGCRTHGATATGVDAVGATATVAPTQQETDSFEQASGTGSDSCGEATGPSTLFKM